MRIATARSGMASADGRGGGRMQRGRGGPRVRPLHRMLLWFLWPLLLATAWSLPAQAAQAASSPCLQQRRHRSPRRGASSRAAGQIAGRCHRSTLPGRHCRWRGATSRSNCATRSTCRSVPARAVRRCRCSGSAHRTRCTSQGQPLASLLTHRWFGHMPVCRTTPDRRRRHGLQRPHSGPAGAAPGRRQGRDHAADLALHPVRPDAG